VPERERLSRKRAGSACSGRSGGSGGAPSVTQANAEQRERNIERLGWHPKWTVGNRGQFRYFYIWFEDPFVTYWQMVFYDRIFFNVSSIPPDINSLEEFDKQLKAVASVQTTPP
jgi:hypothetical protein